MRQSMLDAGFKLINEHGFAGVGLMKIINEAQGTKGSFYHYFKSKEHFGETLLSDYFEEHLAILETFLSDDSMTRNERVKAYFQYWATSKLTDDFHIKCLVVKLAGEISGASGKMQMVMAEGAEKVIQRMAQFFEQGNTENDFTIQNPEDTSRMIYSLWLGSTLLAAMQKRREILNNAMKDTLIILKC